MVGAGVYVDEIEHVIALERVKQKKQRNGVVLGLFALSSALLLIFWHIGAALSRATSQPILERMRTLSKAADGERLLFPGDLHNRVGDFVAHLKGQLIEVTETPNAEMRGAQVDECLQSIDVFSEHCHKILRDIYPPVLDHGVSTAFTYFLKEVKASTTVQFVRHISEVPRSDSGRERALGQGLVQNALIHAGASLIEVTLAYQAESVTLRVKDNGRGFRTETVSMKESIGKSRFGLPWILAQVEMYEGKITLDSSPGSGTTADISMPWPKSGNDTHASEGRTHL